MIYIMREDQFHPRQNDFDIHLYPGQPQHSMMLLPPPQLSHVRHPGAGAGSSAGGGAGAGLGAGAGAGSGWGPG